MTTKKAGNLTCRFEKTMKRNFTLLSALLTICIVKLNAQEISHTFGAVSNEEMLLEHYEQDPEAGALVLFDIGKAVFTNDDNGFDIQFVRTKRIKIYDKTGLDQAEIAIPYYQDGFGKTEIVTDIEAYTYNMEFGRVVKHSLDKKNIFVEKRTERWFLKKFALPQVKEGSVIEIKYTLKTPFKYNLPDWEFQDKIPTLYSEYEARMVPFYEYSYILQGANKFDHFEAYEQPGVTRQFGVHEFKEMTYKFVMKDVPAFKDESYISSINDYIVKLDFQLAKITNYQGVQLDIITTWPKLNNELLKHTNFGKFINASEKAAKKILESELYLSGKTETEKCEAIVNYVKSSFTWDGYSAKYAQKSTKDLLKEKAGNSAEINLFLIGMLKAAGLESNAVLVSTRSHGKIPVDYPFEHFFNDLISIVKIDGKYILTDATEDLLQYNRIPYRTINDKGLMVVKDGEYWVTLNQNNTSIQQEDLKLNLLPNEDSVAAKMSRKMTEYIAFNFRSSYQNKKEAISTGLVKEGFYQVNAVETENYKELNDPYSISFESKTPVEKFENRIFVSPFLNLPMSENVLKQEKRVYPIDMVIQTRRIFKSELVLPETYTVAKLPDSYPIDDELIQINYTTRLNEGTIYTQGSYFFKKAVYQPEEYATLKKHLDKLVQVFNSKIVLSKAN